MTAPDPLTITEISIHVTGGPDGQTRDGTVRLAELGTVEARRLRGAAADAEAGVESSGFEDLAGSSPQGESYDVVVTMSREGQPDAVLDTTVSSDWDLGGGARQELIAYLSRYLEPAIPGADESVPGPEQAVGPT